MSDRSEREHRLTLREMEERFAFLAITVGRLATVVAGLGNKVVMLQERVNGLREAIEVAIRDIPEGTDGGEVKDGSAEDRGDVRLRG